MVYVPRTQLPCTVPLLKSGSGCVVVLEVVVDVRPQHAEHRRRLQRPGAVPAVADRPAVVLGDRSQRERRQEGPAGQAAAQHQTHQHQRERHQGFSAGQPRQQQTDPAGGQTGGQQADHPATRLLQTHQAQSKQEEQMVRPQQRVADAAEQAGHGCDLGLMEQGHQVMG